MVNEPDALDGFRGRAALSDDELMEDEIRAFQELRHGGVDMELVGDVLRADELVKALNGDRPLARLVTYATQRLDECSKVWQASADPASVTCLNAHREARAARILIDWIENEINVGRNAERVLMSQQEEAND